MRGSAHGRTRPLGDEPGRHPGPVNRCVNRRHARPCADARGTAGPEGLAPPARRPIHHEGRRGARMTTSSEHFPRDTGGLPAARPTDTIELADGECFELRIAPVTKRIGDATVRMLAYNGSIPGPTLTRAPGLGDRGRRDQRRRPGGDRALARAAAGEPLRRHARDAGADPGRRPVLVSRPVPRPGRLLVPPAHPRGLRPGAGPVRQHPRRPGRSRLLGPGAPRARAHARRHADRGRPDRAVQPRETNYVGDGPLRQRPARRRRDRPQADRQAAARSCACT